jgi:hypothetical protein
VVDVVLVFRSGRKAGSYLLASALLVNVLSIHADVADDADDVDDVGDVDDVDDVGDVGDADLAKFTTNSSLTQRRQPAPSVTSEAWHSASQLCWVW